VFCRELPPDHAYYGAEGEKHEQEGTGESRFLNKIFKQLAQGWLFGRPAAASEIPRLIAEAAGNQAVQLCEVN
jgi:sensor c-di-GMP phosphodiesterase-like protein